MTIQELEQAIELNKNKEKMLLAWLAKYFENPYRAKVLRDLDSVRIELKTKEFNLTQLRYGLPSHGEEMPAAINTSEGTDSATGSKR
jgi:hypothetical protein